MKRWSLLSIPLVGLASITVWTQAVTGAPTTSEPGVIVREPTPRDPVLNGTENLGVPPRTSPTATPRSSSPALKSGPLDPDTTTENPDEESGVELVEPRQVTSPAVESTDDSTSSSQLDGKDGLSGTSRRSGSSNE
jgi:hypothetical protein